MLVRLARAVSARAPDLTGVVVPFRAMQKATSTAWRTPYRPTDLPIHTKPHWWRSIRMLPDADHLPIGFGYRYGPPTVLYRGEPFLGRRLAKECVT